MTQPIRVAAVHELYEYDGTNSADLLTILGNIPTGGGPWYILSETAGEVVFAWDNDGEMWLSLPISAGGALLIVSGNTAMSVVNPWENSYTPTTEFGPEA